MINYIKGRVTEVTSLHGGALIAIGVIVILGKLDWTGGQYPTPPP